MGPHGRALQETPGLKLSIVVPAFNEERLLAGSLASIKAAARVFDAAGGWELIVCDNNSTDRTAEIARAAGARVVFEPHNQIAKARNIGAKTSSGDWLVFIDADSTPSAGLFAELKEALDSGIVIGGGTTIAPDSETLSFRVAIRFWNVIGRCLRWAAGSFVYSEAKAFREIGGFNEELYASEELDFSQRLKRLGRERGKEFRILQRHPLHTSDRKIHLYGWKGLIRAGTRFVLSPRKSLRSAEACSPWYDGRR